MPQIQERTVEVAEIIPQKLIPERIVGQMDDVPVPQILNEIVEVVKAVKIVHQERISEGIGEQIDDDILPVDQPGDQARCDTQDSGDAEKGLSDSDCIEDSGSPAGEVRRQSCGLAGTVSGDDSSEESVCDTDRSSIFDGLMAKLRQESSSSMDDLARSSWRQDKSARKRARYRGWRKAGHDSWSWAGDGWSWRE